MLGHPTRDEEHTMASDLPHLTVPEMEHVGRADTFLKATEYLAALGAPGFGDAPHMLYDARYCARGVLEMAATVNMLRAGRIA